jgi:hypothetical protein
MTTHVKVLAALFIAFSALGLLLAIVVIVGITGAAGIVGVSANPEDSAVAIPIMGMAGTIAVVFLLIVCLPGLITGIGLLSFKPWARIVGIVLSAINLINIPLGTILGGYGLWVLLSKDTERLFMPVPATPVL